MPRGPWILLLYTGPPRSEPWQDLPGWPGCPDSPVPEPGSVSRAFRETISRLQRNGLPGITRPPGCISTTTHRRVLAPSCAAELPGSGDVFSPPPSSGLRWKGYLPGPPKPAWCMGVPRRRRAAQCPAIVDTALPLRRYGPPHRPARWQETSSYPPCPDGQAPAPVSQPPGPLDTTARPRSSVLAPG